MNKYEFIDGLRRNLAGEVPTQEIDKNVRYYDEYITSESRERGSEEAVITEIGEPRLIARTIIETYKMSHVGSMTDSHRTEQAYEEYEESYQQSSQDSDPRMMKMEFGSGMKVPFKYKAMGIGFVVVLILLLIIIGQMMFWLLRILLPVLLVAGIVAWITRIFK